MDTMSTTKKDKTPSEITVALAEKLEKTQEKSPMFIDPNYYGNVDKEEKEERVAALEVENRDSKRY